MPTEWEKLPWFYRKAALGQIGLINIKRDICIEDQEFQNLFASWKRSEIISWSLLIVLGTTLIVGYAI